MESLCRKMDIDGRVFYIWGLIHDSPFITLSTDLKREITELFQKKNTICEDGFSEWVPESISFKEDEYFGFNKIGFFQSIPLIAKTFYKNLFISNFESNLYLKVKSITSLKELTSLKLDLLDSYQLEPDGMNSLISKKNAGSLENQLGEFPLRVRRYLYEAKTSLDYAEKYNLSELNILVGCAHELPLEYLLKNKNILNSCKF